MSFDLKDVVPWGRSFYEYRAMFSLSPEELDKKILGCGDGPASFNYHMNAIGRRVVSIDPLYQFTKKEIETRINDTFQVVIRQTEENKTEFVWEKIRSVAELGKIRREAMELFLSDYEAGKREGRYVYGELPVLALGTRQFDIALCSHFLFLYSGQFSAQFHLDSIAELCRVAEEVRIFPILELGSKVSRHLKKVCDHFQGLGYTVEISTVGYEFQKGGNQLFRIRRNALLPPAEPGCQ